MMHSKFDETCVDNIDKVEKKKPNDVREEVLLKLLFDGSNIQKIEDLTREEKSFDRLKKYEIIFQVNYESMTFKDGRVHEFPNSCKSIIVVHKGDEEIDDDKGLVVHKGEEEIDDDKGQDNNGAKNTTQKKKAKCKWIKRYLCISKGRKWVRKFHPKDD
ncbi:hypothetical protein HAX54_048934 [Datura stramonium]|uniref:Uncharacterized protein n=1 Tax=Datura stramonium TaxID=4076 RepID=A0ABS8WJX4_DATST|nr:hypothetical protein [Datura stramonium]